MVPVSVRWVPRADTLPESGVGIAGRPGDQRTRSGRSGWRGCRHSMTAAKENFSAIPADTLQDFTQFAPPAVAARAMRMYSRLRIADRMNPPFNLVISNVPGPPFPLYSGRRQAASTSTRSRPSTDGQGLNVTVQSYNGNLDFGFIADRELVPDVWAMTELLHESMDELLSIV